ncbi:GTPase [Myroides marinus]|uniref:GTPase n=1 Tax=Myroides marinus TaxID=703342 RepID=UPI002575EDB8|nr:GTPase domain-containing protein [Myroides marinus]MDM1369842.1 GTPase domain-containing protein [Myroides marinus]MDM1370761.1 GTPase domain-containing protein [Myroides marinus]MDM1531829.1 GTPase domain-containing protein [Myroides marinus]MDM1538747.1 GTPase domain-containing protein [Myroides marinus]
MKSKYNFVIIGKSGVGKSSLINYFFNKEVAKTGAGAPVTQKEFEIYTLEEENQILQIYDSWGIEGGKTEEWLSFFHFFMKERKGEDVEKWINTAIYCISAESNRIEEYDKKIINSLIAEELSPIIAITKSDADISGDFIKAVKRSFPNSDVISITSVHQSLGLGKNKRIIEPIGIDLLKESVFENSANTFCKRIEFVRYSILSEARRTAISKFEVNIELLVDSFNSSNTISQNDIPKLVDCVYNQIEAYDLETLKQIEEVIQKARTTFTNFQMNNLNENYLIKRRKERISNEKNENVKAILELLFTPVFLGVKKSFFSDMMKSIKRVKSIVIGTSKDEVKVELKRIVKDHFLN